MIRGRLWRFEATRHCSCHWAVATPTGYLRAGFWLKRLFVRLVCGTDDRQTLAYCVEKLLVVIFRWRFFGIERNPKIVSKKIGAGAILSDLL